MQPFSPTATGVSKTHIGTRPLTGSCARVKDLGYITGKRLNLYGEHFEMVSDPFTEGDGVVVRAISGNDPTIQTIRLPVSILVGLTDLFPKHVS